MVPALISLAAAAVLIPSALRGDTATWSFQRIAVDLDVKAALQSLTLEDFDGRESLVRNIGSQGTATAADLLAIAGDDATPLKLRARYMLRRAYWNLAANVLKEADSADPQVRATAWQVFDTLSEAAVLEAHHHGGLQKLALIYERLERPDLALDAHQKWQPRGSGCGTCDASIAGERTKGMLRCYLKMTQEDEAETLCWTEITRDSESFETEFALTLVERYAARGELAQLSRRLKESAAAKTSLGRVVQECIFIHNDFKSKRYARLLPQLKSHLNPTAFELEVERRRDWKAYMVAHGFGRMGDEAVPLLAEYQRKQPYADPWLLYALHLTHSKAAVEPMIQAAAASRSLQVPTVLATLKEFRGQATPQLIALLDHRELDVVADAASALSRVGTEDAVAPLIDHLYGKRKNHWAAWVIEGALERLTGETLGIQPAANNHTWAPDAKARWNAWWAEHKTEFQLKPEGWWETPAAYPFLIEVASSGVSDLRTDALRALAKLEHPALAKLLNHENPYVRIDASYHWQRFDPRACMPVFIEMASGSMKDVRGRPLPPTGWQPDAQRRLHELTGVEFKDDATAWKTWWEENEGRVEFTVPDRWW